jgi:hypothetical protein
MENPAFTEGMIIQHQSYHGDYKCTLGRVTMSGGDGMNSCTRVPTVRCAWGLWPHPVVLDSKCCCFPRPWHPVKIYPILEVLGWSDWMSRPIPGWRGRRGGQRGGEIVPAHVYYNEEKAMVWITLGFSAF